MRVSHDTASLCHISPTADPRHFSRTHAGAYFGLHGWWVAHSRQLSVGLWSSRHDLSAQRAVDAVASARDLRSVSLGRSALYGDWTPEMPPLSVVKCILAYERLASGTPSKYGSYAWIVALFHEADWKPVFKRAFSELFAWLL